MLADDRTGTPNLRTTERLVALKSVTARLLQCLCPTRKAGRDQHLMGAASMIALAEGGHRACVSARHQGLSNKSRIKCQMPSVVAVGCVGGIMLQPRRTASYCAANNEAFIQTGCSHCIELADSGAAKWDLLSLPTTAVTCVPDGSD